MMPILRPGAGTLAVLALCSHFACLECLPIAPTPSRSSPLPPRLAASSKLLGLRGGGCFRGGREKQKRGEADERKALEVAAAAAAAKAENAGFMGSLSVVFYLLTSLTLTLMNKLIFSQFQFPLFVTEFQLIVSMAMLIIFGEISRFTGAKSLAFIPPVGFEMSKWLVIAPVTALFVTMLSFTNSCLRHVDIGFYQVLRSTVIPFNIILNYSLLRILPSTYASLCCVVVVSGFVLGSLTEVNFSQKGFVFGIISSFLVALYSSSVKRILPVVGNDTWKLMHYTTLQGMLFLGPLVFLSGEWRLAMQSAEIHSPTFWIFMLEAAIAGFLINLAYFALIKFGSPLTTHITGCTKTSLQTLLGILIFNNQVSALNAAGIALTLAGSTLYSMEKYVSPLILPQRFPPHPHHEKCKGKEKKATGKSS